MRSLCVKGGSPRCLYAWLLVQPRPYQGGSQWQKPLSQVPRPLQLCGQNIEKRSSHTRPFQPCSQQGARCT
jgi:hypothetical protein